MASPLLSWLDSARVVALPLVVVAALPSAARAFAWVQAALRYAARHTGVPALLIAAVLLVVGFRLLRKTARFLLEIAVVAAALLAATYLGWLRW